MINRYSDHAANERTFLAWIRTAIAVMAFGFLVEKFELFLEVMTRSLGDHAPPVSGRVAGDVAGLMLIVLGGVMMVIATVRFHQIGDDIDAADTRPAHGKRMDLVLVTLLVALGATLFVYLLFTVLRQIG